MADLVQWVAWLCLLAADYIACGTQSLAGYCGNLWFHLPAAVANTAHDTAAPAAAAATNPSVTDDRAAVMEWQFSADNIKKEPKLEEMLSSFALSPGSLKTLKLSSPGVPETTSIAFFGKNPGWLSQRTFTADIFTCPPNSHEGRQQRPCTRQQD